MAEATNPITTASNPRVGEDVGRECCVPDAGEPSFVLLGRDPQAPGLVELWAHERSRLEPNSPKPAMACEIADRMRAYKLANPDRGLQVPSTGSGKEETKGADWLDQPIGDELVFEGMRFGKGAPLRTVIKAAQRWRRDAVAAFGKKVEARKSDGGARILAGLDDALAWAKGDASRGKLVTVKDGKVVDVADPAPFDRDHVVSARLIPWEPGGLGGVDLTFESGLRVALPISEPEATPQSSPSQTPVDPQMTVEEARQIVREASQWAETPEEQVAQGRNRASVWEMRGDLEIARLLRGRADKLELALRTLQASGEVRS